MHIPLQNIDTADGNVYLFLRDPKTKKLQVIVDNNFQTYYYKENSTGDYYTYDGKRAYKIKVDRLPKDIRLMSGVYESDVSISKKYILEKDIEITPSPTLYCFIDIEVLMPEDETEDKPISCISVWNSHTKNVKQFYLGDYLTLTNRNVNNNFEHSIFDPSAISQSENGTLYFDTKTKYNIFRAMTIGILDKSDREALKRLFKRKGKTIPFYVSIDPTGIISDDISDFTKYVVFEEEPQINHVIYDKFDITMSFREIL